MLNILKYICYTLFINQRVYLTRLDISRFKKGITSMFKIDERLPKESAKDYVVRQLVYNIVHINLTPGQQLDSDEISELLNVSKNPIREAELELSQTRLIEIKPKIGAYVSLIDANIVEEVRELRSVLEAELGCIALWHCKFGELGNSKFYLYITSLCNLFCISDCLRCIFE